MYERITASDPVGPARYGHDFRYRLAAGFISRNDCVVDAACGSGYGLSLLDMPDVDYYGADYWMPIDFSVEGDGVWLDVDLESWEPSPSFLFDVFLGFETIEHLHDYTAYLALAKNARKWIIMSVPVVPTVGVNPYHHHDFVPGQLQALLEDENWEHYQTVQQPSEFSEIVVMRRRT